MNIDELCSLLREVITNSGEVGDWKQLFNAVPHVEAWDKEDNYIQLEAGEVLYVLFPTTLEVAHGHFDTDVEENEAGGYIACTFSADGSSSMRALALPLERKKDLPGLISSHVNTTLTWARLYEIILTHVAENLSLPSPQINRASL